MQLLLLIIQIIIILILFVRIFKKNKIRSVFFLGLFVYTIFTEINAIYYPEFINRYVSGGSDLFYQFFIFNTLSLIMFYICFEFYERIQRRVTIRIYNKSNAYSKIAVYVYTLLMLISLGIMIINWNSMSYVNNLQHNYGSGIAFVRYLNDFNVYYLMIVLSAIQHTENKSQKRTLVGSAALCVIDLAIFTFRNGDRSVIALVLIGIFILYFYKRKLSLSSALKMVSIGLIGVLYMFFVRSSRNVLAVQAPSMVRTILQDDYAYPALTIIGVIKNGVIDPLRVITSFISKATGIIPGDYLYKLVYEVAFPQFIAQAAIYGTNPGIGLHIFTEGYVFAGMLGFLYNGLILNFHTRVWETLIQTNDEQTNKTFAAIITGVFFLIVRGETVYFFRNFIVFILPVIVMDALICNKSFRIAFINNREKKH